MKIRLSNSVVISGVTHTRPIIARFEWPNPLYISMRKYSPYAIDPTKVPEKISLAFINDDDRLEVPRGMTMEDFDPRDLKKGVKIIDKRTDCPVKFPEPKVSFNKDQTRLLKSFKKALANNSRPFGGYSFVAHTSAGKTIFQAAAAAMTGQRTLVICFTNNIQNAWRQDLGLAFGLTSSDIGLIQQSSWNIGEQFTLASIATLALRKHRWPELFERIGCVVVDEQHKLEPRLVEFLQACPAKYLIGATATDRREGEPEGQANYLTSIFGPPVRRLKAPVKDTATSMGVRAVELVYTKFQYQNNVGELDLNDLMDSLAGDDDRNNLIVKRVMSEWKAGHTCLLVTTRLAHAHLLNDMLTERGAVSNMLTGETNSKKFYTQKLIRAVLSRGCRLLVSTVNAIKLGANLNPIDRLIVVYPPNKTDLEQLIGRMRRKAKGKTDNKLLYLVDANVPYLYRRYLRTAPEVFAKLRVPGHRDVFVA